MVLVRALVGGAEVSLVARDLAPDPLLPSHLRIEGVDGVSDPSFPALRFRDLVLPRPCVLWYATVDVVEPPTVEAPVEPPVEALDVERRIGSKQGTSEPNARREPEVRPWRRSVARGSENG